jgi:hypothetical protein
MRYCFLLPLRVLICFIGVSTFIIFIFTKEMQYEISINLYHAGRNTAEVTVDDLGMGDF